MPKPKLIDAIPVTDAELVPIDPLPLPEPAVELTPAQHRESLDALKGQRAQGEPLSHYEQLAILDLYHKHKLTQVEIANRLNVHQSTVSRTLVKYADSTVLAQKIARARAAEGMDKIFDHGEPKDIIKVLQGTRTPSGERVLEASKVDTAQSAPNVYVGVKVSLDELKDVK